VQLRLEPIILGYRDVRGLPSFLRLRYPHVDTPTQLVRRESLGMPASAAEAYQLSRACQRVDSGVGGKMEVPARHDTPDDGLQT